MPTSYQILRIFDSQPQIMAKATPQTISIATSTVNPLEYLIDYALSPFLWSSTHGPDTIGSEALANAGRGHSLASEGVRDFHKSESSPLPLDL